MAFNGSMTFGRMIPVPIYGPSWTALGLYLRPERAMPQLSLTTLCTCSAVAVMMARILVIWQLSVFQPKDGTLSRIWGRLLLRALDTA